MNVPGGVCDSCGEETVTFGLGYKDADIELCRNCVADEEAREALDG